MQSEKIVKPITNQQSVVQPQNDTLATSPSTAVDIPKPIEQSTDLGNEKKEEVVDSLAPSGPYYLDPLFYEVSNYFGIKQEEYSDAKNKLSEIVDYAIKERNSNKPEDVLSVIREMENKLQPAQWGTKRYQHVALYVRLAFKEQALRQTMKAYEKSPITDQAQ